MKQAIILDILGQLRAEDHPDSQWNIIQNLYRQMGFSTITFGTGRRKLLDSIALCTNTSTALMNDYMHKKLAAEDPWLSYCQNSFMPATLDVIGNLELGAPPVTQKLKSLFADHGMHAVCLLPVYGGLRPGGTILYAQHADQADLLRSRDSLSDLHVLSSVIAAYWRPEDVSNDDISASTGIYRLKAPLSAREREALLWLSSGLHTEEIASRMRISAVTVSKHFAGARRRLGARTREQALAIAIRDQLLHP